MGTSFLNISNNWLLHTDTHLFAKSVSCRSANFTTGDFECMVRLKKVTLQKFNGSFEKGLEAQNSKRFKKRKELLLTRRVHGDRVTDFFKNFVKLKFPYVVKKWQSHTTHYTEILEKTTLIFGKIFSAFHIPCFVPCFAKSDMAERL